MATMSDLVRVDSALAHEAGFRLPLYLIRAVHQDCAAWTDEDTHRTGVPQDETGRLWDLLWMAVSAVRRHGRLALVPIPFGVYRVPRTIRCEDVARAEDGDGEIAELVRLRLRREGDMLIIDSEQAEAVA
jgi:hypothetical protein